MKLPKNYPSEACVVRCADVAFRIDVARTHVTDTTQILQAKGREEPPSLLSRPLDQQLSLRFHLGHIQQYSR